MEYIIGIDVGTSSARTIIIDKRGKLYCSSTRDYPLYTPEHSWAEQDCYDWYKAVIITIRQVLDISGIDPKDIAGIGLSGQMHGLVALDSRGEPLRKSIIWCDNRSYRQTEKIYNIFGFEGFIRLSYNQALPGYIAPKLLWLKDNEPQNFKKTKKVLLPKDYIRYKLSGKYATEVSDASGTVMMDIVKRDWSKDIIDGLDMDPSIMPDIFESVEISSAVDKETSRLTGLLEGTPIAGGGGDNAAGAVGTGIIEEGLVSDSIGTSGVVFVHTDRPVFDSKARFHCTCHTVPGKWNLLGATLAAGGSYKWYMQNFGPSDLVKEKFPELDDDYRLLDKQAEKISPGCEGLIFCPYLIGERTPYPDPYARGIFFGLSYIHGQSHFARAILEGVAYSQLDCIKTLQDLGLSYNKLIMIGGGSRSRLWRQILADITGIDVAINNISEGPAFGAALIAGTGVGLFDDVHDAHKKTVYQKDVIRPREKENGLYKKYYSIYRSLYASVKEEFKRLSQIG